MTDQFIGTCFVGRHTTTNKTFERALPLAVLTPSLRVVSAYELRCLPLLKRGSVAQLPRYKTGEHRTNSYLPCALRCQRTKQAIQLRTLNCLGSITITTLRQPVHKSRTSPCPNIKGRQAYRAAHNAHPYDKTTRTHNRFADASPST